MTIVFAVGICSCSKNNNGTHPPKETILYQTNFSADDGKWAVGNINKGGSTYYQNGSYGVIGGVDINTFTYSYTDNIFTGISGKMAVSASVSVTRSFNSGGGGNGGLIWNCQPNAQEFSYDVFEISYTGQWGIFQFLRTNTANNIWTITAIAPWTTSSNVQTGQYNNLQVMSNNGQLQFSLNGTQVYEMTAASGALDQAGLFADVNSTLQANHFEADDWQ